ncbi:hypothetical protein V0288_09190 [Pannus brasiliensis CCIBt3594]|uniref:Uncharacterized protein n=1 Tax=Pannus brasiliensis CCIBt3594 TaxID=1427578 RepID=A0AAW9QST0_9CHRO
MPVATCYCTKEECDSLRKRIEILEKEVKRLDREKCETRECSRIREIATQARRKVIQLESEFADHKSQAIPKAHKFEYKPNVGVNLSGNATAYGFNIAVSVSVDRSVGADSQAFNLSKNKPTVKNSISLAASKNGTLKVFSSVCVDGVCSNDSSTVTIPLGKSNPFNLPKLPTLPRINLPTIRPVIPLPLPIPKLPPLPIKLPLPYGVGIPSPSGIGLRGVGGGGNQFNQPVTVVTQFNQVTGILTTTVKVGSRAGTGTVNIVDQEIKNNVKRIYQILGGDQWFEEGIEPKITLDTESYIKGFVASQWGLEAEKTSPSPAQIKDMIDVVGVISSLNYFRQGLQEYPLEVPKDISEIPEDGQEEMETIPYASKFDEWRFRQLDALFGQFPIKIRIEDNDLIKTGDQPVEVKLPNLAETVAELVGKSITNEALVNLLANINFRLLNELGSTKLQGFKSHKILEAIATYLGYEDGQKTEKIRFLYNPNYTVEEGKQPIFEELLKETEIDVIVDDMREKTPLEGKLDILLYAANIIKASLFEEANPNSDADWENYVKTFKDLVKGEKEKEEEKKDDLDDFLQKVEEGFTQEPGIIDPTKPYGRSRDQRPRIRKLGATEGGID